MVLIQLQNPEPSGFIGAEDRGASQDWAEAVKRAASIAWELANLAGTKPWSIAAA